MKIILLLLLTILTSCSSMSVHTPATRMISPEAQGHFGRVSAEIRWTTYQEDQAAFEDNTTKKPLSNQKSKPTLSGQGELGLLRKLDVYANPNFILNAPNIAGLKFQVIGKPRIEAKKGDFSLSLTGGLGRQHGGGKSSYDGLSLGWGDSDPDNVRKVSFTTSHEEAGLVLGYRWSNTIVHYLNTTYFHQYITGTVSTDNDVLNDKRFDLTQDGILYSTGAIHYFSERAYYKLDFTHMSSGFSTGLNHSTNSLNAALGLCW